MKLVIYQSLPSLQGPNANIKILESVVRRARLAHAELVVFPELFLSGYNVGIRKIRGAAQATDGSYAQTIAALAKQYGIAIAYGYPERDGEDIYNAALIADHRGRVVLNYRKTHLYGDQEKQIFSPGQGHVAVVDIGGWAVSMLICYDVEFPEMTRQAALVGPDLIVVPTALMLPYTRIPDLLIPARAYENQLYIAYANFCGEEQGLRYCGKSTIAAPDGRIRVQAAQSEALLCAELSRDEIIDSRRINTYLADRRPECYTALVTSHCNST